MFLLVSLLCFLSITDAANFNIDSSCSSTRTCTSLIRNALNSCASYCTITLGSGVFDLDGVTDQTLFQANSKTNFVFRGAGSRSTVLRMTKLTGFFDMGNSSTVTFSGFSVGLIRPPFTAGVAVSPSVLKFDSINYPIDLNNHPWLQFAQTISSYSSKGYIKPELYFSSYPYITFNADKATFYGWNMQTNATYIIRHRVYSRHIFYFNRISRSLTFTDVEMNFGAGMGIVALYCQNILLQNVKVRPPTVSYPMSLTADGAHLVNTIGSVTIKNCLFQGQGDDAINIVSVLFNITGFSPDRTLVSVIGNRDLGAAYFYVGHWININSPQLQWKAARQVVEVTPNYWRLSQPLPPEVIIGDIVYDSSAVADPILITSNTFQKSRARGILARGRNMQITNNIISQTSGPAIYLHSEACYWYEGPASSHVLISGNSINNVNAGPAQTSGSISVTAESIYSSTCTENSPFPIHYNLTIKVNTISSNQPYPSIYAAQTTLLSITKNVITRTGAFTGKEIVVRNSFTTAVTSNTCNGVSC